MGQSGTTEGPARAHPTEPGAPFGDARRLRPQLARWVRASGRLAHWTGGGLGHRGSRHPMWASQTRPQQALPVTEARLGG